MAVYKRNYQPYTGQITPQWCRFLVLPRYIYRDVFSSKLVLALFVASFVVPVGEALLIYLRYNLSALNLLRLPVEELIAIDGDFFFYGFLMPQSTLAFLLTVFVAPGLVSMDLANNALPLYFCRPFDRKDYVLGKMSVLVILLSLVTWVPGLLLVLLNGSLAGFAWLRENWWIGSAIFLSFWIWILVLSLLSLAISAWVKWRPVAGAMLFGVLLVAAGFGEIINQTLYVTWGTLLDVGELISIVTADLFHVKHTAEVSLPTAWLALLTICGICLWVLSRRLKAYEVIR